MYGLSQGLDAAVAVSVATERHIILCVSVCVFTSYGWIHNTKRLSVCHYVNCSQTCSLSREREVRIMTNVS